MASGQLRFRTPHIEEIPIAQAKRAAGFAWVALPNVDPAKQALEVTSKKRSRASGVAQTEVQKDASSNRRQREIERRVRELNTEGSKDLNIPIPKDANIPSGVKAGKTSNTKKILASGKEFKHYLDDEEAELARTGKIDGVEREDVPTQRASKTPLARRLQQEDVVTVDDKKPPLPFFSTPQSEDTAQNDFDAIPPFPSADVVQALLDAPPLTYNVARLMPTYAPSAPPRAFCEICGFWGRTLCLQCGSRTCSADCEAIHLADRCLKFYV